MDTRGSRIHDTSFSPPTGSQILHRRKQETLPGFGIASKVLESLKDAVESTVDTISRNVSLDAFSHKKEVKPQFAVAPIGVTHSYSIVLTHIVAPLWSVGDKRMGIWDPVPLNNPEVDALCAALDKKGVELEHHLPVLKASPELTTIYLVLLLARLLSIESSGNARALSFAAIVEQLLRDVKYKGEYEEHNNDESNAPDQAMRKLSEVGGTWKPRGASDIRHHTHLLRHQCLKNAYYASVCLRYIYTDETLQFLCDSLASQLFLLSYSETLVMLVAGIKGPKYVAKYLVHLSGQIMEPVQKDCVLCGCEIESLLLQDCATITSLAVQNLVHRNDTGDILVNAMTFALGICPTPCLASLFALCNAILHRIYIVDLSVLVGLMEASRAHVTVANPVGTLALEVMNNVCQSIRCALVLQRRLCTRLFVAGATMRSFRLQPVHIIATPYCARSFALMKIYLQDIDLQRGPQPMLPVSTVPRDELPPNATRYPIDDVVMYLANLVSNTYQSVYELAIGDPSIGVDIIDLVELFSLPPQVLCPYLPSLFQFLSSAGGKRILSDTAHTDQAVYHKIMEFYLAVRDTNQPTKGQRRMRLESPRVPHLPMLLTLTAEADDLMETLKSVIDRHWKFCDHRILETETAALHPSHELSLSHFLEDYIRLAVAGGGGLLRRFLVSFLHMRSAYPGAVPRIRFYIIPLGHTNDLASWIARNDPIYRQTIYSPFMALRTDVTESPSPEAMAVPAKPTLQSLELRRLLNTYFVDANQANEVVIYQVECFSMDGTIDYIPFICGVEVGVHLNKAVATAGKPQNPGELVSHASFSAQTAVGRAKSKSRIDTLARQSSSFIQRPSTPGGAQTGPLSPTASSSTAPLRKRALLIGENVESVERILVKMHGTRGLPFSTRNNLSKDSVEIPQCVSGVDVLDWISTSFHVYDAALAARAAQSLLEAGLIITASTPVGRDASKFHEDTLYVAHPRDEIDTAPICPSSLHSSHFEIAQNLRAEYETNPPTVSQCLKLRVSFVGLPSDISYNDLSKDNAPSRDVISLKLKSTGSANDVGGVPDPTDPSLNLCITELEKRRSLHPREPIDQSEHYRLRFGNGRVADLRCCLTIESVATVAGSGFFISVDGDVFGPFVLLQVRPVTIQASAGRGLGSSVTAFRTFSSHSVTAADRNAQVVTLSIMSFLKCGQGT